MNDCIFCKMVSREVEVAPIYEDEFTFAFLSNSPNNLGHTLVIPKKHYENVYEIDEVTLANVATTAKKIAIGLKKGLGAEGVNIIQNNERAAGQAVFHLHVHIIPRYYNDGFKQWADHKHYKKDEAEQYVEKIKEALTK
jgi:histidine triad (HIT) family protein